MRVVSLFDGISCGKLAFDRAGITLSEYSAYEINPLAVKVSKKNWDDIAHYGDVEQGDFNNHNGADIVIGGSPCQSLSCANVGLQDAEYGVNGKGKSSLFWHYIRAIQTIRPKYFLLENVASMKKVDRDIISRELGVEPVKIDSVMFSPQIRRRLYWTNIEFTLPQERLCDDVLEDILESQVSDKYYLKEKMLRYIMDVDNVNKKGGNKEISPLYAHTITASCWKMHRADTDTYIATDYKPVDKTNVRRLTPIECERLQTLPDNYTLIYQDNGKPYNDRYRYEMIGNAFTADVIAHILKQVKERF